MSPSRSMCRPRSKHYPRIRRWNPDEVTRGGSNSAGIPMEIHVRSGVYLNVAAGADGDAARAFTVRLHAAGCSLRETAASLGLLGVKRTHGAVWSWVNRLADSVGDQPSAQPTWVAVDETAVRINGEWSWVYDAIILETKVLLDATVFGRRGTDPAAAFLHGLTQKHDCSQTMLLVDGFGYLTALLRLGLSGRSTTPTETTSQSGFTLSRCGSTASTRHG